MYTSTLSLTSAVDGVGGQRHSSAALLPGKTPRYLCTRGWVGPRTGPEGRGKSCPTGSSIPTMLSRAPLSPYTVSKILQTEQQPSPKPANLHPLVLGVFLLGGGMRTQCLFHGYV